jgi:hypothetical protein
VADLLVKHDLVVQTRGGPALNKGIDAPRKAGAFRRTTLAPTGNADRLMDPIASCRTWVAKKCDP